MSRMHRSSSWSQSKLTKCRCSVANIDSGLPCQLGSEWTYVTCHKWDTRIGHFDSLCVSVRHLMETCDNGSNHWLRYRSEERRPTESRQAQQRDLVGFKVDSHSHVFDWSSTIFVHWSNVSPDARPRSQSSTSCKCHAAWMRREIPWSFRFAVSEDWERVKHWDFPNRRTFWDL